MKTRTVATVFGTRPEIIKLSSYIEEMDKRIENHFLVHTNQHYDYEMDKVFFKELEIRKPDFRLSAISESPVARLGEMIQQLSKVYKEVRPEWVIVQGDTDSTLAGAISAKKFGARLAHIESGCRSFESTMPEEQNRILVDHISDLLFAPTKTCVTNLRREGVSGPKVRLVGSTLIEVCNRNLKLAERKARANLRPPYALMTIHRRCNIENKRRLKAIVSAMRRLSFNIPVIFPTHPHTRDKLAEFGLNQHLGRIRQVSPYGYLDFIFTLSRAEFVLTDSGGVQQEAQVYGIPTLTARDRTEWGETIESGGSILVDADESVIVGTALKIIKDPSFRKSAAGSKNPYRETGVASKIVDFILANQRGNESAKETCHT